MRLALDRQIILQRRKKGNGRGEWTVEAQTTLMCSVSVPGTHLKADAAALGYSIALTVQLWRSEFEEQKYTHAIIDGKEYRIADTGPGRNDLFVRLSLERSRSD